MKKTLHEHSLERQVTVFLSNCQEKLFDVFKENLYIGTTPFSKRIVLLPTPTMQDWVSLQLAKKKGISAGVDFLFLQQGVEKLSELLLKEKLKLPAAELNITVKL